MPPGAFDLPTSAPQPAAGLPAQVPNQPDLAAATPTPAPAPVAAAPAPAPAEEQAAGGAFDQGNDPNALKGSFDDLNASENDYPPKDNSADLPFMDSAKAGMSHDPLEQAQILNKINPNYKARVDGGIATVELNGKRMPIDDESAGGLKALSQHSGDVTNFFANVVPMLASDGLINLSEIKGGAAAAVRLIRTPMVGAAGVAIKNYAQDLWTKVKPDNIQARRDMIIAGGIGALAEIVSGPIIGAVNTFYTKYHEGQVAENLKTVLRGVGWGEAPLNNPASTPISDFGSKLVQSPVVGPEGEMTQPGGIVNNIIKDMNSKFEPLQQKAIAASPNGKVTDLKQIKQLIKTQINEKSAGGVSWSDNDIPSVKSDSTYLDNGYALADTKLQNNPARYFHGSSEGAGAIQGLINDYNQLSFHERMGGAPFEEFNNMVKRWGEDSQFSQFRSGSPTSSSVQGSFRQMQHVGSELRMKFLTENLTGPDKQLAQQAYRDYASRINPASAVLDLYNSNNKVPELFVRSLMKPENSNVTGGLVNLLQDLKPDIVPELRQSFLHVALTDNTSASTGVLNHQSFMSQIDSMGEANKNILFPNKVDYFNAKRYSKDLMMLAASKGNSPGIVQKLAKASSFFSPIAKVATEDSPLVSMAKKNPTMWGQVGDQMMAENVSDVPAMLRANTMGRTIKDAVLRQGWWSPAQTLVKDAATSALMSKEAHKGSSVEGRYPGDQ